MSAAAAALGSQPAPPAAAPPPPYEFWGDSVAVARGIPAEGGIAQAVTGGGAAIPPRSPPVPPPPLGGSPAPPPLLGRRVLGASYAGCGPEAAAAAAAAASVSRELLRRTGSAGVYSTPYSSDMPTRYSCRKCSIFCGKGGSAGSCEEMRKAAALEKGTTSWREGMCCAARTQYLLTEAYNRSERTQRCGRHRFYFIVPIPSRFESTIAVGSDTGNSTHPPPKHSVGNKK